MMLTVLFTLMVMLLAGVVLLWLVIGGATFVLAFADVIVFGTIVYFIVRYILKKKREKKN